MGCPRSGWSTWSTWSCQYLAEMALGAQGPHPFGSSEVVRDPAAGLSDAGGRPWGTLAVNGSSGPHGPHPFANSEAVREPPVAA